MKRLITVITMLALTVAGGSLAWAGNPDPLHIGSSNTPAALEGGYQTGSGLFQFLMIASPQNCNDGTEPDECGDRITHLWFYTAACARVDNKPAPLTKNDVSVFPLHDPFVTSNRVGNVLVAAIDEDEFDEVRLASNAVIGQTWFIDANRGIGRIEDMARLAGGGGGGGTGGTGWRPYVPAHVLLFAPPDNGVDIFGTLIFRCPQGTAVQKANALGGTVVGTVGTLGGDMLDLASQARDGADEGTALDPAATLANTNTLCQDCNDNSGTFAKGLQAFVYDLDENFLRSREDIVCQCLGAKVGAGSFVTELRLKDIAIEAASQSTYWEILSFGGTPNPAGTDNKDTLFTAALNVQVKSTVHVNFYTRLHNARSDSNIED